MIRKYIVCGKQIFFSSKKREEDDGQRLVELSLPIEIYWDVQEIIKETDYLIAQSEDKTVINARYADIYRKIMSYAVQEKDRLWLMDKVKRD